MTIREVEAALRAHPGVRDAAALVRDTNGEGAKLIGYVVPHAAYLEKFILETDEGAKRLQKWRKTFDLMQFGKEAAGSPVGFNIAGWNSSYTRQPIPAEEMREWVEETVKSILALGPREVLEIGCGTGLLLLRIAPTCTRYVGTDFSGAVLQRIREQVAQSGASSGGVTLCERPADNFDGWEPQSFDTVILNSVVQYFPSVAYLTGVLENALRLLKPRGKIFVGDVLSLPLLEAYSASVELFQASPLKPLVELREQVQRRMAQQPHLLISPSFFLALQKRYPAISRVEIRPKSGRFDNELTRFRFDATIFAGDRIEKWIEPEWRDWSANHFTMEVLRQTLETRDSRRLALKNVPNARVQKDVAGARAIVDCSDARSVGDLNTDLGKPVAGSVHPHDLFQLAKELGFHFDWSWANSRDDGSFDALFWRLGSDEEVPAPVAWPQPDGIDHNLTLYTNTPGRAALQNKLVHELLEYSRQKLDADLCPAALILVDAIPRDGDGQPKFDILPLPDASVS